MDYGRRCDAAEVKGEIYVAKGDNLHLRLERISGRLNAIYQFSDGLRPSFKKWFEVDNRPGPDIPENRRVHSIPQSRRKPTQLVLSGQFHKRVDANQPQLYWFFDWSIYTRNARGTITWTEFFAINCPKEPFFDIPDWKVAFRGEYQIFWNKEVSGSR